MRFRVGPSSIHGNGIFSCGPLLSGKKLFTTHYYSEKHKEWINIIPNCMYNHSLKPNCESKTQINKDGVKEKVLYSLQFIKKYKELTVDFNRDKDLEQPEADWKE